MDNVKAWIYAGLRAGIQGLWTTLLSVPTVGVILGALPAEQQATAKVAIATAMTGVLYGLAVAGIRWLETRNGEAFGARAARLLAKVVMFGLTRYQPVYAATSSTSVPRSVSMTPVGEAPFGRPAQVTAAVLQE